MSNDKQKPVATQSKPADLKQTAVAPATTNQAPEPKPAPQPTIEDKVAEALMVNVTKVANELVPKRGDLKVVDLEPVKYGLLFSTVEAQKCGFKKFGKVTNFPTAGTIIKDDVMYRKMQKLTVELHGGTVHYHANQLRWFAGKGLSVVQRDELMKTRPEPAKPAAPATEVKK